MPPRKRARYSTASSPQPASSSKQATASPTALSPAASHEGSDGELAKEVTARLLADPWTDAEETALFRAVVRHKPTGLHKHMAMLNIYTSLSSQGFSNDYPTPPPADAGKPVGDQQDVAGLHLSTRGIWQKLGELYDLDALDEREEEVDFESGFGLRQLEEDEEVDWADGSDEEVAGEDAPGHWGREFRLPSTSTSRSASPSASVLPSSEVDHGRRRGSVKAEQGGHASWSWLKWSKRFPSASPTRSVSSVPPAHGSSPPSASGGRRGARRTKIERRESSPALCPELLASRHDPPVRFARKGSEEQAAGRKHGRENASAKKARVSTAASARSRTSEGGTAGRRRGRAASVNDEEGDAESEGEDGGGDERDVGDSEDGGDNDGEGGEEGSGQDDEDGEGEDGDDDNDNDNDSGGGGSESSSAPEEPETPVKRKRGRPPGAGAARGARGRGRGGAAGTAVRRGSRR